MTCGGSNAIPVCAHRLSAMGDVVQGETLQTFAENTEVMQSLDELPTVVCDLRRKEIAEERFTVILNRYQEQPHLLDPHLGALVSRLLSMAREQPPSLLCHQAFRYLYLLSKVRGAKVILRWFSHEVSDLEPVLSLLESQDPSQYQTWETRYILLLWLSIIAIIPFNLCLMDGEQQNQHVTLNRIIAVGQHYILQTDKARDAAPVLLSRVLTRPDVHRLTLTGFLEWCKSKLTSCILEDREGVTAASGVLATLASLFKLSKREDVEDHASDVLRTVKACNTLNSGYTMLRKLSIKLAQRVGMVFLPARVASWRYQRGLRSLTDTLSLSQPSGEQAKSVAPTPADEEDWEVREEVEEVMEILLCGLRDWESVVRWSSAKGIGRVTGRLPRSLADDVLQSLLTCFSAREGDSAWHGGCLALAELGRRGLLLPRRLADVVPAVLEALIYDEMRGTHSVGTDVRDAACYVCWSFARAYEPQQLKPHVTQLASGLLVTALFDREVNCRRAAAAAFQENVGRQGTFPHGIDILTNVDYFAVGSRTNSYLNLSSYVAQYTEYTQPLIDHVVQTKLGHWDSSLRELAARALHNLTPRLPDYIQESVIPKLLPLIVSVDPRMRHGALRAVTQMTTALCSLKSSPVSAVLGENLVQQLVQLVPQLEGHGVFRGAAGECMRPAALTFISKMSSWQRVIDANLPHTEEFIREAAVTAFHAVSLTHYISLSPEETSRIIQSCLSGLSSPLPFTRMGYCLALGALTQSLLSSSLTAVLDGLVGVASNIEGCEPQFTESRRDAVRAISCVCTTVGVGQNGLSQASLDVVFHTLAAALNDYTTDARGDIGVVVREAAMVAASDICQLLTSCAQSEMAAPHVQHMVCLFLQQASGKIDRTRSIAFSCLQLLLHCKPHLKGIPHHDRLASLFQEPAEEKVNWSVAATTFPLSVQLLALPEYTYHTLLGLVISCGGLTESTVRASRAALLDYLRGVSGSVENLEPFTDTILEVFRRNSRVTRVTQPLLVTLDLLLSNAVFDAYLPLTTHTFPRALLALVKEETALSADTKKLLASINVYCGLLQFPGVRTTTLNRLMLLLCHKFPTVRRGAADQLYATVITYDDVISEEVTEEVCSVLAETKWESDLDVVREKRNKLCGLLGLQRPVVRASGSRAAKPTLAASDTMASYRDLVDRAGY